MLTFAQDTFTVFYQEKDFATGNKVKVLTPKINNFNFNIATFIVSSINYAIQKLTWGTNSDVKMIENIKFYLPLNVHNDIDFQFIELLMSQLTRERISELESYLKVSGLKNYTLTEAEKKFINYKSSNDITTLLNNKLLSVKWNKYKIDDIFKKITTKKLPYKAKKLPCEPTGKYVLPCLTSSFINQGLNYYVPVNGATILKNVISIPSNSDVYRAYFQSNDFTVLSDAYAICWKDKEQTITENAYLFMTQCINKVTDLPIYSYKNKLGWNKTKENVIVLPEKDGKIDFDFMDKFILILKKLIIKDVVEYTSKYLLTKK